MNVLLNVLLENLNMQGRVADSSSQRPKMTRF